MQIKKIDSLTKDCLFSVLFEATVKCIWYRSHIFFVGCRYCICFWHQKVFGYYHIKTLSMFSLQKPVTNTGNDQLMKGRLLKILRCRIYLHKFNKELKNVLCRPSLILSTSTPPVWDFFMGMYEYMFYEIYEGITNADFYDDIRVQLGENKDK